MEIHSCFKDAVLTRLYYIVFVFVVFKNFYFILDVRNVCQNICRGELEAKYGILLPQPTEDTARCPTAYELLTAYASKAGLFMLVCSTGPR